MDDILTHILPGPGIWCALRSSMSKKGCCADVSIPQLPLPTCGEAPKQKSSDIK